MCSPTSALDAAFFPAEPLGNSVTSIFQATTQTHERNAYLKAKIAPIVCGTIYRAD